MSVTLDNSLPTEESGRKVPKVNTTGTWYCSIISYNSVQVQWVLDNVKSATKLRPSTSALHVTYLIALWSVSRNTKNFHVSGRHLQRPKQLLLLWNHM